MGLDQLRVNRLWEAVLQTSHELVWELDPSGLIRFMTDSAEEVLGESAAQLTGRNVLSMIHPCDVDVARQVLADCVENRIGWERVRLRVRRRDGQDLWLESSGVAHVGSDDLLLGFTATARRLDADDARAAELSNTRQRIERVMEDRLLTTVWQPIFSLNHGRIVGVEALSRFPDAGERSPDRWFRDAFDVGLGHALEGLAVGNALSGAASFPPDVYVSVNLSSETVAAGELESVMRQDRIDLDRVVIELTEQVSIDNYQAVSTGLAVLRDSGARLAVDDAGAGFASFRHILQLQPDMIKLDQSITRGITDNPAQRALATALVLFALEVGSMTVTAEGVDTAEDLATVSSLGLDAAQGMYMAAPCPPSEIDWSSELPVTSAKQRRGWPRVLRRSAAP